jgi:peptide/nickel transport system substrate-binding protein
MIGFNKVRRPRSRTGIALAACLLIPSSSCRQSESTDSTPSESTLVVGFGLGAVDSSQAGVRQTVRIIATEGLVDFDQNGRPRPWLAERWGRSPDGLGWRIWLRPDAVFHDGEPVTAATVREILLAQLPDYLGDPYEDVQGITAVSEFELEIRLKRPSAFVLEGLEIPILRRGSPVIGTGPFRQVGDDGAEMQAYSRYYGGPPAVSRIEIRPYPSVRSAWAEMLRNNVDVLYEVGIEALDSLGRSSEINIFTFDRPYVYTLVLNSRHGPFRDQRVRQALNRAIDRQRLVSTVLDGHGKPADGPIPPSHWARDPAASGFMYAPEALSPGTNTLRFTCIFGEPSLERMALEVQRQLQEVGVGLTLQAVSGDELLARLDNGRFECALADIISGPNLLRHYWFWHSSGAFNWGRFESSRVDAALDAIRHAASDDEYKRAVGDFQRALVDDPPGIFLAWSQRARAVSTRFEVPTEAGRDILSTLRRWRPAADKGIDSPN